MVAFLLLFLAGAIASWLGLWHLRRPLEIATFQVDVPGDVPVPVDRVRRKDRDAYPAHFLLLHGYGATRRHLLQLAEVLAAAGGDVYLPDLPGRGNHPGRVSPRPAGGFDADMETPNETRAALAVAHHLQAEYGVRRDRLVLVGHSMGGGVALDVARRLLPTATVSLAGLEREVAPGQPPKVLFITARFEIPPLREAADRMHNASRGGRSARKEFWATHSSLPLHSSVQRAIVDWTNQAVPGAKLKLPQWYNEKLLALDVAGLFFLVGLFAPLAGLTGWLLDPEPFGEVVPETRFSSWSPLHLFGYALAAGVAAVTIIYLFGLAGWPHPLSFLRLDGSYLASVLLLSTLGLVPVLRRQPWVRDWGETAKKLAVAVGLAAYVVVMGGAFATWQLFDLWPTWGRLGKMLILLGVLLPYALGEELLMRTFAKRERGGTALSAFLLWRLALLAGIFFGVVLLGSGQEMLIVIAGPLLALSLVEYFFFQSLYRALNSAYADALLKAVLLGWILATVFPLK